MDQEFFLIAVLWAFLFGGAASKTLPHPRQGPPMVAANVAQKLLFQESCYFTWKLNLLSCTVASGCEPLRIAAADFQRQVKRYYTGLGPPPLDLAYTAVFVDDEFLRSLMQECFPMYFIASLMVATSQLYINAPGIASGHFENAMMVRQHVPDALVGLYAKSWPMDAALQEFQLTVDKVQVSITGQPIDCLQSVHLVICHCAEDLSWIDELRSSKCLDLFIYEKCNDEVLVHAAFASRFGHFKSARQIFLPDDPLRKRNECIAYLQHIMTQWGNFADFTVFLQGDGPQQVTTGLLDVLVAALPRGVYNAPFLALGADRMVEHASACRDAVYTEVFGKSPPDQISTYCCAHLVVHRTRIEMRPRSLYERMAAVLDAPENSACPSIPSQALRCLMFEQFWHILFGAHAELPLRAEDADLPMIARVPDRESRLSINESAFTQRAFSFSFND